MSCQAKWSHPSRVVLCPPVSRRLVSTHTRRSGRGARGARCAVDAARVRRGWGRHALSMRGLDECGAAEGDGDCGFLSMPPHAHAHAHLLSLPTDALNRVFVYLESDDVVAVEGTCRALRGGCTTDTWAALCLREIGIAHGSRRDILETARGEGVWDGEMVIPQNAGLGDFERAHAFLKPHYNFDAMTIDPVAIRVTLKRFTNPTAARQVRGTIEYLLPERCVHGDGRGQATPPTRVGAQQHHRPPRVAPLDATIVAASVLSGTHADAPSEPRPRVVVATHTLRGEFMSRVVEESGSRGPADAAAAPPLPDADTEDTRSSDCMHPSDRRMASRELLCLRDTATGVTFRLTPHGRRGYVGTHQHGGVYLTLAAAQRGHDKVVEGSVWRGVCTQHDFTATAYPMEFTIDGVGAAMAGDGGGGHNCIDGLAAAAAAAAAVDSSDEEGRLPLPGVYVVNGEVAFPTLQNLTRATGVMGVRDEGVAAADASVFAATLHTQASSTPSVASSANASPGGVPQPPLLSLPALPFPSVREGAAHLYFCEYHALRKGPSVVPTYYSAEVTGDVMFGTYSDHTAYNHGTFALRRVR